MATPYLAGLTTKENMANNHKQIVFCDKTFKRLFTPEERENIQPLYFAGGNSKVKNTWAMCHGSTTEFKVHTESHGIIKCRKIDATKGPFP